MKKIFSFFVAALFGMTLFADNTTIYCKMAHGWWYSDGAVMGAYLWKGEGGDKVENAAFPGVRMTVVEGEENLWKVEFEAGKYEKIIFSRVSGSGDLKCWDSQTEDLTLPTDDKDLFTISSAEPKYWKDDKGDKVQGDWSKFVPTPVVSGYYITGDSALVVDAAKLDKSKAWDPKAIKSEKDTFVLALKKEVDYQLKVVVGEGEGAAWKGFSDLTKKAAGLSADKNNNICFKLTKDGEVKVVYKKDAFELIGEFYVAPIEEKELKLVPGLWKADGAKFAAWIWGPEMAGEWTAFFAGEGDTLSTKIKSSADSIIFVRLNSALTEPKWNTESEKENVWNELSKEKINYASLLFVISAMDKGAWDGKEPEPQPGDAKFYVTGDSALVVDAGLDKAKAWDPAALKSEKDTLVLKLKKDVDYKLKITLDGDWKTAKGYGDLTDKTNLSESEGNISFKLKEDGDVQVIYFVKDEKTTFELKGNLVEVEKPSIENGYYLIGQKGWDVAALSADLKFAQNGDKADEYKLEVTLKEGEKLKVVEVAAGDIKTWYPDGMGTDYVVDAAHAGDVVIYFKAVKNEEWKEFGGFMYIERATAIDNTAVDAQTVKFFRNGQLLIMKNGVIYNAQGAVVE